MKAPIHSKKHIVQHTQFTVASAAVTTFTDIDAVAVENINIPAEVVEGAIVKAVYVELWLLAFSGQPSSFVMILEKVISNGGLPSFTDMTTLNAYPNKKNVLYVTQGLTGGNESNPTPVYRGWIKIPKGKQRFGLRDKFRISIASIGAEITEGCGMTIYKEYN